MPSTRDEQVRLHLTVTGRVQGVAFRYATLDEADGLRVTGWVRNRRDGSVEIVAEGPRDRLERLAIWCHDGPPAAIVSHVVAEWSEATGEFGEFQIRY